MSATCCHSDQIMTLARKVTEVQKRHKTENFDFSALLSPCANEISYVFHLKLMKGFKFSHVKLFIPWDLVGASSYEALKTARGRCSSSV